MDKEIITGHIYVFLFPNGKRYVGQTIRSIERRTYEHKSLLNGRYYVSVVCSAIKKYGKENVKLEKTFTIKCTQEYLNLLEDRCIVIYNTLVPNGYNLKRGGSHGTPSEETKAKMSIAHKGKPKGPMAEETKAKLSASHRGMVRSEETRAKISAAKKGPRAPHSEETKAKISAALRGHPGYFTGKHHSETTKAKLSAYNKGKHLSVETRVKVSLHSPKRGKPAWNRGQPSPFRGMQRPPEVGAKVSATKRSRTYVVPEEVRAQRSARMKGRPRTPKELAKREATRQRNMLAANQAGKLYGRQRHLPGV